MLRQNSNFGNARRAISLDQDDTVTAGLWGHDVQMNPTLSRDASCVRVAILVRT